MAYINNRYLKGTKWWRTHTGLFKQTINDKVCYITPYHPRRYKGQTDPKRVFRVEVNGEYLGQRNTFMDAESLALNRAYDGDYIAVINHV